MAWRCRRARTSRRPAGKDVLAKGSAYARPGSGFMPGYVDVQKAFQDAFTAQIQGKTYDAGPVVEATKAAIDKALASPVVARRSRRPMTAKTGGASRRGVRRCASEPAPARRSEALAGYAHDRGADGPVPGPPDRHRLLRPVHQPVGWNIRSGPVEFRGLPNYATAAVRPDLPAGRPELALLRGRLGPA